MPGIIVPRKTVAEVQRLIEDNEAEVNIELSQGKIRFRLGDTVLTSKLIDGTFPDYVRVIPLGNDKELTVDKKEFEQAVDRARLFEEGFAVPQGWFALEELIGVAGQVQHLQVRVHLDAGCFLAVLLAGRGELQQVLLQKVLDGRGRGRFGFGLFFALLGGLPVI